MEEEEAAPPPQPETTRVSSPPPSVETDPTFDPTRMIGIIKRKALIKDLAAVYHAECLTCCHQLLELQRNQEEPYVEIKTPNNLRRETTRPIKRVKNLART